MRQERDECGGIRNRKTRPMKIILDANVLVGTSQKKLESMEDELIVPKVTMNEIFTTSEWAKDDHPRAVSVLQKIKDNGYENLILMQPEDMILTWSGKNDLPPLPSQTYSTKLIDDILSKADNHDDLVEILRRFIGYHSYEKLFAGAIKEMTVEIGKTFPELKKSEMKFFELDEATKDELRRIAKGYYRMRVLAYLKVHEIQRPEDAIPNPLNFGADDIVVDVMAAYLYHRTPGEASSNDQFDIKYPFYLGHGDVIWSRDKLLSLILDEHLRRDDLLYKEDG